MQQTGADLFPPIFDYGETLADIDGNMASLTALFIDSYGNAAGTAEPMQPAEKFAPVHITTIDPIRASGIGGRSGLS